MNAGFVDDDGQPTGETIEDRLMALAREIRRHNDPDAVYAAGQSVYETGFNPVNGRVRLTGEPLTTFAEWVEVVPTRQVVPVPYVAARTRFRHSARAAAGAHADPAGPADALSRG